MKSNALYISLTIILIILLTLVSDPFMLWMPPFAIMCVLLAIAFVMCIWAGFVMKESVEDEREALHRMNAGRVAYLSGSAVLTVALLTQGFTTHTIDPWIVLTLGVMVASKLIARIYFERVQ